MKESVEIFDTGLFKIFALPLWKGYLLVSVGSEEKPETFFLPGQALESLMEFRLKKEAP